MDDRSRLRQFEEQIVGQLRVRAAALVKRKLPADAVIVEPTPEGGDALRDTLRRLEIFDRDAMEQLPGSHSMQLRFVKSYLGGLMRRVVSRVRVRALAPVEALLRDRPLGPVGREEVELALARYRLLPRHQQPTGVILASATGFSPEARRLVEAGGPPTLVLLGQRGDGGWEVDMPAPLRKTPWAQLFELETPDDRVRRVLYHLQKDAAVVDSRGLALPELAQRMGMSERDAEALVRQVTRLEPRVMTVNHNGVVHVSRAPLAEESRTMSLWSRVRRWLRMKPTVAERVREMRAQQVRIEQERHELDQKVDALETAERTLLQQGAAATNDAERKQAAGKLVRARTELKRTRTQAQNLTNALDVLGTHIHHLTLAEQNKRLELPKAAELTREAASAEQMATELAASADLARSIEVSASSPLQLEEEAAIFEEFKQVAEARSGAGSAASAGGAAQTPPLPAAPLPSPSAGTNSRSAAAPEKREAAKPELG